MTAEDAINDIARRCGLEVAKGITTGNEVSGFAEYHLTGDERQVIRAAEELRQLPGMAGHVKAGWVGFRRSAADGKLYAFAESVWFDTRG